MLLASVALAVGLLLLVGGGDLLVARCAHLAASFHVPKAIVGAVIIGFGTSLPELFVSLTAAIEESLRAVTGLRGDVALVAPGALANDGKVIDDRRPLD